MDDKTRMRCKVCGSEFDDEYIEYYLEYIDYFLETDDPESDCIGHCPVCWGIDIAAISIIDPEAIRRKVRNKELRDAAERAVSWQANLCKSDDWNCECCTECNQLRCAIMGNDRE